MYKLELLEKVVALCLYSGYLMGEKPLSLLIIAPTEAGKSRVLKKFLPNKGVKPSTDVTPYGFIRDTLPKIRSGEIKHLIMPDLLGPMEKAQAAQKRFVSFMSSLIEDGIADISTFYFHSSPFGNIENLKCGLLTALPYDILNDKRRRWTRMGFMSRLMPFSYSYTKDAIQSILDFKWRGDDIDEQPIILDLPSHDTTVECNFDWAKKFEPFIKAMAKASGVYGFRYAEQVRILLKANALAANRATVTQDDMEEIAKVMIYLNLDLKPIA